MSTTQGKFVWYDLMTSDSKAARSSDPSVIGWDAKDFGMADRSYTLFSAGPMMVGGMMPIPEEARAMGARPAWNGYVLVDDVDVYAERVKAAGGEDIPGVGRFRSKPMAGRAAGLLGEIEIAVGVDPAATLRKLKIRRDIREVPGWGWSAPGNLAFEVKWTAVTA